MQKETGKRTVGEGREQQKISEKACYIVGAGSFEKLDSLPQEGDLVIAADTVVYIDGEILGKPKDLADANRFMHLLSGHVHTVFTGVCMAYHGERVSFSQETKVKFYPLTESEIAAYVQSGEPMGKAGGYGIQGPAALFVESIEGDYNNIFGLPAAHVMQEAKKLLKADKI